MPIPDTSLGNGTAFSALAPYSGPRSSPIPMFGYRPPNISTLTTLSLSPSSVSRNSSRGRDGYSSLNVQVSYEIAYDLYLLDIVVRDFHAANWSSIASINSTRSSESAPRSFAKCVSLVTNSMSTRSCLATRVRTSLIEKHSLTGRELLRRC